MTKVALDCWSLLDFDVGQGLTKGATSNGGDGWPFVHLVSDRPDLRFSENHFDLAAGEVRTIAVTGSTPFGPRDVTVRCWNDRWRTPTPEFLGAD